MQLSCSSRNVHADYENYGPRGHVILHALQIGVNYTYADIKVDGHPSFKGNLGRNTGKLRIQTMEQYLRRL